MPRGTLRSTRIETLDPLAAIETYFEKGWTDGLPVVPPTEEKIWAMLDAMSKQPEDIIGEIPARARTITAEKLAINAILAGCLPIYAPVLLAATEALCDPAFSVHGPTASTSGMGVLTIVNGPIASQIGMNAGENLLGRDGVRTLLSDERCVYSSAMCAALSPGSWIGAALATRESSPTASLRMRRAVPGPHFMWSEGFPWKKAL